MQIRTKLGAAAIALFTASMMGLAWYFTGDGPTPAEAQRTAAQVPEPAGAPLPAPLAQADAGAAVPAPPASHGPRPERVAPPALERPEVGRAVERAPVELFSGLRGYAARVQACAGASPAAPGATTMVSLRLQTLDGRVRVTGAEGRPGTEALVGCVRRELVGQEFAVSGARPGRSYQMPYPFPG